MNTSLTGKVEGARSEAPDVVDKPPPPCTPTGPSPRACGGRPHPSSWSSCAVSAPARHCRRGRHQGHCGHMARPATPGQFSAAAAPVA